MMGWISRHICHSIYIVLLFALMLSFGCRDGREVKGSITVWHEQKLPFKATEVRLVVMTPDRGVLFGPVTRPLDTHIYVSAFPVGRKILRIEYLNDNNVVTALETVVHVAKEVLQVVKIPEWGSMKVWHNSEQELPFKSTEVQLVVMTLQRGILFGPVIHPRDTFVQLPQLTVGRKILRIDALIGFRGLLRRAAQ